MAPFGDKENACHHVGLAKDEAEWFEDRLSRCELEEAISLWTQYSAWAESHCPDRANDILHRACYALLGQTQHKDSQQHLQLWVLYADRLQEPLEAFDLLRAHEIGVMHSLFYEALAICYEKQREFAEAEHTYQEGLSCGAEPHERLQSNFKAFQRRMQTRKRREEKRSQGDSSNRSAHSGRTEDSLQATHPHPSSTAPEPAQGSREPAPVGWEPSGPARRSSRLSKASARSSLASNTKEIFKAVLCRGDTMSSFASSNNDLALEDPTYTTDFMNRAAMAIIMGEDTCETSVEVLGGGGDDEPRTAAEPRLPLVARCEASDARCADLRRLAQVCAEEAAPARVAALHPPMYAAALQPVRRPNGQDQAPRAAKTNPAPSFVENLAPKSVGTTPVALRRSSAAMRKSLSAFSEFGEDTVDFEQINGNFDAKHASPEKEVDFEKMNSAFDAKHASPDARTCSFGFRRSSAGSCHVELSGGTLNEVSRVRRDTFGLTQDTRTCSFGLPAGAGGMEIYEDSE